MNLSDNVEVVSGDENLDDEIYKEAVEYRAQGQMLVTKKTLNAQPKAKEHGQMEN